MDPLSAFWKKVLVGIVAVCAAVIAGMYIYVLILQGSVDAARARASEAETRASIAEEAARVNAEAVQRLSRLHEEQLAAIARDAQEARERAERTASAVENLRRDPTHTSAAAPVLGRAVERLRKRRSGGEDRTPTPAVLPAAAAPETPASAGGGSADAGHGG